MGAAHGSRDPAFARAVDEAVAAAKARLAGSGGSAPPSGWGSLDGEELLVRGSNGRKVQVARARLREFSPRVEARFLSVLAATCNVKAACAEIGLSASAVYAPQPAAGLRRALGRGDRDRLCAAGDGAGRAVRQSFAAEAVDPDLTMGPATVAQAMQLLFQYKHRIHKLGKPPRRAEPSIEEVRRTVTRAVSALERGEAIGEASMEEARRDWAARRRSG